MPRGCTSVSPARWAKHARPQVLAGRGGVRHQGARAHAIRGLRRPHPDRQALRAQRRSASCGLGPLHRIHGGAARGGRVRLPGRGAHGRGGARRSPLDPPYSAVIVDEAQDLTCAMVRMLHALVGDDPDAFTLIGDGQQTIYPGGYTLAEAGISVAGRGVVFDVNYRNTAEILAFAAQLVEGSEFADIEGEIARGDALATIARHGPEPVVERCAKRSTHDARLVRRVQEAVRDLGTGLGDVGVLCGTRDAVARAERALGKAGDSMRLPRATTARCSRASRSGRSSAPRGWSSSRCCSPRCAPRTCRTSLRPRTTRRASAGSSTGGNCSWGRRGRATDCGLGCCSRRSGHALMMHSSSLPRCGATCPRATTPTLRASGIQSSGSLRTCRSSLTRRVLRCDTGRATCDGASK